MTVRFVPVNPLMFDHLGFVEAINELSEPASFG